MLLASVSGCLALKLNNNLERQRLYKLAVYNRAIAKIETISMLEYLFCSQVAIHV